MCLRAWVSASHHFSDLRFYFYFSGPCLCFLVAQTCSSLFFILSQFSWSPFFFFLLKWPWSLILLKWPWSCEKDNVTQWLKTWQPLTPVLTVPSAGSGSSLPCVVESWHATSQSVLWEPQRKQAKQRSQSIPPSPSAALQCLTTAWLTRV